MKILWNKLISVIDTPIWLEFFFLFLIIVRIPSFFEPYYYGDEMIYLAIGEGMRQGIPLYLSLHDNKPPLLYLTAAISGNLFIFKAILAFWNLLTVYGFWKLAKHLFPKNKTLQNISTILFGLLTTLPLFEGNTVNAELFMITPIIFAFLLLLSKKNTVKNLIISGVLFSVGALYKIPAAFDIFAIIAYWIICLNWTKDTFVKEIINFIKKTFFLSLGFIIPIALTFIWFYFSGSFKEYLTAAFLQNFGYVSSWRPSTQSLSFVEKNGPLLIRFAIMIFGFLVLFLSRKKASKEFVFITAWLLSTLFAVTLSERPYPHYFVQSLAPISLLVGMLISLKNVEQSLTIIPLTIAFFVPFYYKFWYYPTFTYYQRFINFSIGNINREEYFNSFSNSVYTNYKVADFISKSTSEEDKVFVWSNDSAAIYALSRKLPPTKYVADYHFIDFSNKEETMKILKQNMPKFIVTSKNSFAFPELYQFINQKYYIIQDIGTTQIWLSLKK